MLFAEVVAASAEVGSTRSRTAKSETLAGLLQRLAPEEIEVAVGFLVGEPRQGRIGIGWKTIRNATSHVAAAAEATLAIHEVDQAITDLAGLEGPGSGNRRRDLLTEIYGRSTEDECRFLTALFSGELRQGALAGVMTDAVAKASSVPGTVVRRAVMFGGRLEVAARMALTEGRTALEAIGLTVGRPVQPMLASTASTTSEAVDDIGDAVVEWKLDGIRIQVHRHDDEVRVWTRNLNEITDRVPAIVDVVRSLPATDLVLDGEALVVGADDRPVMFQDTAGRVGTEAAHEQQPRPYLFDLLHLDGRDLVDEALSVRRSELARIAGTHQVSGTRTSDPAVAQRVLTEALEAGHEGVVVKDARSTYQAGRRGKAWRKVKPVHTLDLVVLAVEWGYGRRNGWLSNLHLGARADEGDGFVMVGKTFKGMTDDLLRWQTERFLDLAIDEAARTATQTGTVHVSPEQVVEIAVDGVQRSTTYDGGVALRFARVLRYRHDKTATDADSISAVRTLLPG